MLLPGRLAFANGKTQSVKRSSWLFPLLLGVLLLPRSSPLVAQGHFEFSPLARQAYEEVTSLRFAAARQSLRELERREPQNLIYHLVDNYLDFFTLFIDEDQNAFRRLEQNKAQRLQAIRRGDSFSPYYRYCQAEIKLQWALVRLKFEEYFTAFNEVKSAYRLLQKNTADYPSFVANQKSLGILHAMIGTVPDNYKWGVKLLSGMDGTIEQGRQEIEAVLDFAQREDFVFAEETVVMYAFLLLHLNNQSEAAWSTIHGQQLDHERNPLATFVLANIAMRTGRNDEAITLLEKRPQGPEYHPFPYLDYLLGLAKLYRLDEDADRYLEAYLAAFHGRNYIKEAYQKRAWHHLLRGDEAAYRRDMERCQTEGFALVEGDKTAQREAEQGLLPHPTLLRARLLFDGGYYERAAVLLEETPLEATAEERFRLEHSYRLGRIRHRQGRLEAALDHYGRTIEAGREAPQYFACNAALQVGRLYEGRAEYTRAREYYRICLDLRPAEYRSGLHQQAKAGLNRLRGR